MDIIIGEILVWLKKRNMSIAYWVLLIVSVLLFGVFVFFEMNINGSIKIG